MLELEDIQHFLMMRPYAIAARYEFLTFAQVTGGHTWLRGMVDRVGTAQGVKAGGDTETKWITIGFTWNGLRALGVDEASLATFPEEFREGMAARAEVLGDVGPNHPSQWVDGLATPDLHAIVILFARDTAQRDQSADAHRSFLGQCEGVKVLSSLDLAAIPPMEYSHGRGRRSSRGSSFSDIPTKKARARSCRSRRSFRATAATSRTAGSRSTWARSAIFFGSRERPPRSKR
jgi:hypothetical protein